MAINLFPLTILGPLCAATLLLSACTPVMRESAASTGDAGHAISHDAAQSESHAADTHAHWSYDGDTGPAHWGDLNPEYAACSTGKEQSPIDVDTVKEENLVNLAFDYHPSSVNIINNGHTVEAVYDPGSSFTVDGVQYDLKQFHFHAPSEHTVDGQYAAMEMHLVHENAEGKKAVVGILINQGTDATLAVPEPGTTGQINAADFLPSDQTTFRYEGSLTTPPCTEGVSWFLMIHPIQLSAQQIAAFTTIYNHNNRPIQSVNGRTILADTTP